MRKHFVHGLGEYTRTRNRSNRTARRKVINQINKLPITAEQKDETIKVFIKAWEAKY